MDIELLRKHIKKYVERNKHIDEAQREDIAERNERIEFFQSWTKERLLKIDEENLYTYISRLWAMLIWGNKQYVVDKLIENNGFLAISYG